MVSSDRVASHGRGGAGNLAKDDPTTRPQPTDLVTPTLKSTTYTTGRGGTGNMASNTDPEVARAAQDVDAPVVLEAAGPKHYGRGGAANVVADNKVEGSGHAAQNGNANGVGAEKGGLLAKGKDMLNKLGKK